MILGTTLWRVDKYFRKPSRDARSGTGKTPTGKTPTGMTLARRTVTRDPVSQNVTVFESTTHEQRRSAGRGPGGSTRKHRAGARHGPDRTAITPTLVPLGTRSDVRRAFDCGGPAGSAGPPDTAREFGRRAGRVPDARDAGARRRKPDAAGDLRTSAVSSRAAASHLLHAILLQAFQKQQVQQPLSRRG